MAQHNELDGGCMTLLRDMRDKPDSVRRGYKGRVEFLQRRGYVKDAGLSVMHGPLYIATDEGRRVLAELAPEL